MRCSDCGFRIRGKGHFEGKHHKGQAGSRYKAKPVKSDEAKKGAWK